MATTAFLSITGLIYLFTKLTILSFFIGTFLYFQAFYKHFGILVKEIESDKIKGSDNPPAEMQHGKEIHAKRILREIIQFHIMTKQ